MKRKFYFHVFLDLSCSYGKRDFIMHMFIILVMYFSIRPFQVVFFFFTSRLLVMESFLSISNNNGNNRLHIPFFVHMWSWLYIYLVINAWQQQGIMQQIYLAKKLKVASIGIVSVSYMMECPSYDSLKTRLILGSLIMPHT